MPIPSTPSPGWNAKPWQIILMFVVTIAILIIALKAIPDSKVEARTLVAYEEGQFSFSFNYLKADLLLLKGTEWIPFTGDSIVVILTSGLTQSRAEIKVPHVTNEFFGNNDPLRKFAEVYLPVKGLSKDTRLVLACSN